jgi:hypothetical protein
MQDWGRSRRDDSEGYFGIHAVQALAVALVNTSVFTFDAVRAETMWIVFSYVYQAPLVLLLKPSTVTFVVGLAGIILGCRKIRGRVNFVLVIVDLLGVLIERWGFVLSWVGSFWGTVADILLPERLLRATSVGGVVVARRLLVDHGHTESITLRSIVVHLKGGNDTRERVTIKVRRGWTFACAYPIRAGAGRFLRIAVSGLTVGHNIDQFGISRVKLRTVGLTWAANGNRVAGTVTFGILSGS